MTYNHIRRTKMDLIQKVEEDFSQLQVYPGAKAMFMPYLGALKNKDEPTFEHSVRVAYLSKDIAEFTHLVPQRTLWLPGLVHDIGKLLIRPEVLKKTVGFNDADRQEMRNHVESGCKMLLGVADFSALTLFYHHYFKAKEAYPSPEEFSKIFGNNFNSWNEGTRTLAKYCGRLISIADFYDAITTRNNDKFSPGELKTTNPKKLKEIVLAENEDQVYLIEQLYSRGIFK